MRGDYLHTGEGRVECDGGWRGDKGVGTLYIQARVEWSVMVGGGGDRGEGRLHTGEGRVECDGGWRGR